MVTLEWELLPNQLKRELEDEYGDIGGRYQTFKKVLRTTHVPTINNQSFDKYLWVGLPKCSSIICSSVSTEEYSLGSRRFDALVFENRFKAFWVIRSRWVSCYDYHFPDLNRGWLKSSQHDRGSLCPWFDMCNHSEDPSVRYDYSADNGMVLRAIDDIQARVNGKVGLPSI